MTGYEQESSDSQPTIFRSCTVAARRVKLMPKVNVQHELASGVSVRGGAQTSEVRTGADVPKCG